MKSRVAAGTSHLGEYSYQNMNFGLCRILISTINANVSTGATWSPMPLVSNWNDVVWDSVTISAYAKYVRDHVFAPAGVSGPTLGHASADALAYSFPVNGDGWNSGDLATVSGGAGWHMSVDDLLDVMGTFRRKGTIMSKTHAQTLLDNGFGIDVKQSTPLGTLYNKNGRWGTRWQGGAGADLLPARRAWSSWCSRTPPSARRPSSSARWSATSTLPTSSHPDRAQTAARRSAEAAPCNLTSSPGRVDRVGRSGTSAGVW